MISLQINPLLTQRLFCFRPQSRRIHPSSCLVRLLTGYSLSFYLPDCEYANEFLFNMKNSFGSVAPPSGGHFCNFFTAERLQLEG